MADTTCTTAHQKDSSYTDHRESAEKNEHQPHSRSYGVFKLAVSRVQWSAVSMNFPVAYAANAEPNKLRSFRIAESARNGENCPIEEYHVPFFHVPSSSSLDMYALCGLSFLAWSLLSKQVFLGGQKRLVLKQQHGPHQRVRARVGALATVGFLSAGSRPHHFKWETANCNVNAKSPKPSSTTKASQRYVFVNSPFRFFTRIIEKHRE